FGAGESGLRRGDRERAARTQALRGVTAVGIRGHRLGGAGRHVQDGHGGIATGLPCASSTRPMAPEVVMFWAKTELVASSVAMANGSERARILMAMGFLVWFL